jgi:hypothetical protein
VQIFGHDLFSGSPNPVSLFRDSFFCFGIIGFSYFNLCSSV